MNPFHQKPIVIIIMLAVLLTACGKEAPPPPTSTPEPTATPVPPTETPSVSIDGFLEDAWQAYEDEDYETARQLVEEARDTLKVSGEENGEVYGLLGLIELETGTSGSANFYFEKAEELGYENELITEQLDALAAEDLLLQIVDHSMVLLTSYDPDEILSNLETVKGLLDEYQSLSEDDTLITQYADLLSQETFDPEKYTEEDLSAADIDNLVSRLSGDDFVNLHNGFIDGLEENYPDNPFVQYIIGVRHLYDGDLLEAVESLTASLEAEPANQYGWVYLGHSYLNLGLTLHARDAFVSCLLLNPDNEEAYDTLAMMNTFRPYLFNTDFDRYGFKMDYFPYDPFTPEGTASRQSGILKTEQPLEGEDDELSFLIRISWEDEPGTDQTPLHLQEKISGAMNVNAPGWKGGYQDFDYGFVPMIYREYSFRLPGSSAYAGAVIAGAYCGTTTYVFDFRYLQPGTEMEQLLVYMMLSLESFNCDAEME